MQLSSFYYPSLGFGGPVRLMFDYANWVSENNKHVIIYTGDIHHDYSKISSKNDNNKYPVIRFRILSTYLAKRSIFLISPGLLIKAIIKIKKYQKVFIHYWELRGVIPIYALILYKLFPKRVILIHSAFGQLHYKRSIKRNIYDFIFMKKNLKALNLSLVQNNHEANVYKEYFNQYKLDSNGKIIKFPLHINMNENKVANDEKNDKYFIKELLRNKYNIELESLVLLFLGRLHKAKGIKRVIDVLIEINKQFNKKIELIIIGTDHGYKKNISKYIIDKKLTGNVKIIENVYEDRYEFYWLADVFVAFPTIYEETMLASIEALSCGTPILLSVEAEAPYITENDAGFIINYNLDEAVDKLLLIANNLDYYSGNALNTAINYYSDILMKKRLLSTLDQL